MLHNICATTQKFKAHPSKVQLGTILFFYLVILSCRYSVSFYIETPVMYASLDLFQVILILRVTNSQWICKIKKKIKVVGTLKLSRKVNTFCWKTKASQHSKATINKIRFIALAYNSWKNYKTIYTYKQCIKLIYKIYRIQHILHLIFIYLC